MNYRNEARQQLKRAEAELAANDDHRLRYAALELRFAMEALTYERASAYISELPPEEYGTWQPRRLMAVLLDIDPNADKDSTISVGREKTFGVQARVMSVLGTEKVFNMLQLRTHYDAIGSFLHVPTIKQISGGGAKLKNLRHRCEEVARYIDEVLASKVWNPTFGTFAERECEECGGKIRKRLPHGDEKLQVECHNCKVTYTVVRDGSGLTAWKLDLVDILCGNADCEHIVHILQREVKPGSTWTCPSCKGRNKIVLAVNCALEAATHS